MFVEQVLPGLLAALSVLLGLVVAARIVLRKRNHRAAVAWVGLVILSPVIGSLIYFVFGINRVSRRAHMLRADFDPTRFKAERDQGLKALADLLPEHDRILRTQAHLVDALGHTPFVGGNRVTPLVNGEAAFPAMLDAIRNAKHSVALVTYIFNDDEAGTAFVDALADARERGVEVRVLIDGIGSLYSRPPIVGKLRRRGIKVARFHFSFAPWRMSFINMRIHQKILVVDGEIGFTGGMNIKLAHMVTKSPSHATSDVHFQLVGPVVRHLMATFADEWAFTTNETLKGAIWFPEIAAQGPVIARGLAAGPDQELDTILWTLLGVLNEAQNYVKIVTPYFLPDESLVTLLRLAAMRGLRVDVVMPEANNLALVKWASMSHLDEMLEAGCRFWFMQGSFDHSKLMTVDGIWSFFGSTNWDLRSLRLNFEFNVECCDRELAAELERLIDQKLAAARPLKLEEITSRRLPVRLRDGTVRLFQPYL
jgi:cardiolipin synthase